VIDVSNPSSPREVGFYDTPEAAEDVAVSGTYAYVADGVAGLRVIDVSNPSSPREVGFYDTPGYADGVAVSGTYAYVADGVAGLRVIDVSNPSSPWEVSFCDTPGCGQRRGGLGVLCLCGGWGSGPSGDRCLEPLFSTGGGLL
jgi:uncharacterized secreted protein with C-terminal beta-propeller domain